MYVRSHFVAMSITIVTALFQFTGCNSRKPEAASSAVSTTAEPKSELQILELGEQARQNLNLVVKPARLTEYWRTITIPGVVADRPGISDRGVTSPAVGVVAQIHAYAGETVRPGQRLVTLRLFSEYLQATQTQLFKSTQESILVQQQIDRLSDVAVSGAVSASRIIELRNELQRQQTLIQAAKQELLNRGLHPEQIAAVAAGQFVSSIEVVAPQAPTEVGLLQGLVQPATQQASNEQPNDIAYELQSLHVELGQTVQS
jgi:biotin carboxyl carrier protein